MKKQHHPKPWLLIAVLLLCNTVIFSQTSWKGTTSTNWATATKWTIGVLSATVDVIIGDISFPVASSPMISASATCKSLTIGGIFAGKLTVNKNLTHNKPDWDY